MPIRQRFFSILKNNQSHYISNIFAPNKFVLKGDGLNYI